MGYVVHAPIRFSRCCAKLVHAFIVSFTLIAVSLNNTVILNSARSTGNTPVILDRARGDDIMYPHREIGIQPGPARQLGNPGMLNTLAGHIASGKPVAVLEAPHGIGDLFALPQQLNELGIQNVQARPERPKLSRAALLLILPRIRARHASAIATRGTPRPFATH